MMWFISFMTYFGVTVMVALMGLIFFVWYRQRAAPGPGVVLGEYEVIGCYAGQKIHTRIKGMMVDATSFFCASDLTEPFKDLLYGDIDRLITKKPAEKAPVEGDNEKPEQMKPDPALAAEQGMLEKIKKQLKTFPLDKIATVAIIRSGVFGERHLLIKFDEINGNGPRSLTDYSSNEEESHFTFAFGPVNKGLIKGRMQTLTEPWEFSNERFPLGDFPVGTVHVLVPDDPVTNQKNEKTEKAAWNLNAAKLLLHVPNVVRQQEHMKSIMQQVKDKDFALAQMGVKYSALATETDVLRRAVKGFMTEGQKLEDLFPKKLDVLDWLCIGLFPTVGWAAAGALGITSLVGVIVGEACAGFIIYWRK